MPDRRLSRTEREAVSALDVVRADGLDIDPAAWTPQHLEPIRAAARQAEVARIFANPAIETALCREATGDRGRFTKVRPMFGHDYHVRIRIGCPDTDAACSDQEPPPGGDSRAADLARWFRPAMLHPRPGGKPRTGPILAHLPDECRRVLTAP